MVWQAEPGCREEAAEPRRKYWKVRRLGFVKTEQEMIDESKLWREKWEETEKDKSLGERVAEWADKIWEKGEFHPGAKRW